MSRIPRPRLVPVHVIFLAAFLATLVGLITLPPRHIVEASSLQVSGAGPSTSASSPSQAEQARLRGAYGKLPLGFEVNRGQADARVKFISRGGGYALFLTGDEAVLALSRSGNASRPESGLTKNVGSAVEGSEAAGEAVLRMSLRGSQKSPQIIGQGELQGKSNYFVGDQRQNWLTDVPSFAHVEYRDVYPGINVVYYGNQRQLEYDFVLAPGAGAEQIRLAFKGAEQMRLDDVGNLLLSTAGGEVLQQKPVAYQELNGVRQEVASRYILRGSDEIGFELGDYDRSLPLVIDPVLVYSTFLGGNGNDQATAIAVDASGNAYVTGFTTSTSFPTASALQSALNGTTFDVFVAKFNAAGNGLVYSTYLGGAGDDKAQGIALDTAGNAYLTGRTYSTDFPTANAWQASNKGNGDIFITKLNPSGSALVYSTYVGGVSFELANGIAVDAAGNAYVTGRADSPDFPTAGAFQATRQGNLAFKSSTGGAQWTVSDAGIPASTVNALAVNPATPSTLYAATDAGVYFSTNSGGSWSGAGHAQLNLAVSDLVLDPNNPATLYAATSGGIYKSTDGGGSWAQSSAGLSTLAVLSLTVDPTATNVIYAGTRLGGIFKSSDSGANWVTVNLTGIPANTSVYTVSLDSAAPGVLYAGTSRGVYKSTNAGGSWFASGIVSITVNDIAIDKSSPATLYAATVYGIYKSVNSGGNWTFMTTGGIDYATQAILIDPSNSATLYAATNGGGALKSTNSGTSWSVLNNGLVNPSVYALAINPQSTSNVYAGAFSGSDGFLFKLNAAGSAPVFSTYLGGTLSDYGNGVAVDFSGKAYVTGLTESTNFPTVNPLQPANGGPGGAFVTKFNANGSALMYSTYLGGSDYDFAGAIAVDGGGNAYVTGYTYSTDFPTVNPFQASCVDCATYYTPDAFVSKLNATGSALAYSTYLGGGSTDAATAIAVDASGNAFVAGLSYSYDFPSVNALPSIQNGNGDGFITNLNASGSSLIYSTYLAGTGSDQINGIALDAGGSAYVAGFTSSPGFPTANAFQAVKSTGTDAFVAKLGVIADLSISMLDSRDPVMVGNSFSYLLNVTNNGPSVATGVTVTDALPNGLAFVSAASTQGTCSGISVVTCSLGTLAANATATITITVTPTALGALSNTATVTSNVPDQNSANNFSTQVTTVSSLPSIAGRITDASNNPLSGVTVALNGTASAETQTDGNGKYQFANLSAGGSYTVSPSKQGYTFTPRTQSFSNVQQDRTADFSAAACAYSIAPTNQSIPGSGGTGSVTVTATGDCPWTAMSNASWINITSGGGNGNGTVTFSVAPTNIARSGTLTVAGSLFTVWQENNACGAFSFQAARTYPPGTSPAAITTGDFNNDGKKDIALIDGYQNSHSMGVILNTGAGGFGAPALYQTPGGLSRDITSAFVNNDANLDLIVTDLSGVEILYGNGAGAFGSATIFSIGTHFVYSTVAGDFNNDGKTDLAVWHDADSGQVISILLGDGTGNFGSAVASFPGTAPRLADLNGDNRPDLVVINGSTLVVRPGNGTGSFGAAVSTTMDYLYMSNIYDFADVNGDGKLDVLTVYSVSLGDGAGGFGAQIPLPVGTQQVRNVAAADFDNDAKPDLVLVLGDASTVTLMKGDGTGHFSQTATFAIVGRPGDLIATDFDNDNKLDLAVANGESGTISFLFNACGVDPGISLGGRVVNESGTGLQSIPVTLNSSQLGMLSTRTDANGYYSFDNVPRGGTDTVSVTSYAGYTFSSPQTVNNPQTNQTLNFAGTQITYTVSGRVVIGGDQAGVPGLTIVAGTHTTQTDANGNYSIVLPASGYYVIGPQVSAVYSFGNNPTVTLGVLTNNVTGVNFTATRRTYTLTVTAQNGDGAPRAGVPIIIAGGGNNFGYTGSNGIRVFTLQAGFDYAVRAFSNIYNFNPERATLNNLSSDQALTFTLASRRSSCDFDRDGKTDISVFRPSNGYWYVSNSSDNSFRAEQFGASGDQLAPADYDGDGRTDFAVFRPSNGSWYILNSSNNTFRAQLWGQNGDLAAAGDFDGDGAADLSVFRPSNGVWYILRSSAGFTALQFGTSGDVPVVADYDGDGAKDIAVFRPSTGGWYLQRSTQGFIGQAFGSPGDQPAVGDFDGDGHDDLAVFRPATGGWYIQQSTAGFRADSFGANGDVAAAGDYDGDGKTDVAVFRPSNGSWYMLRSGSGGAFFAQQFGASGDLPAPSVNMP